MSYVGNHGFNRLGAFQNGTPSTSTRSTSAPRTCRRTRTRRWAEHRARRDRLHGEPAAAVPRPQHNRAADDRVPGHVSLDSDVTSTGGSATGFSFGANYTLSLSFTGQHRPAEAAAARGRRHALGSRRPGRVRRAEQDCSNLQRHVLKANCVWDLPDFTAPDAAPSRSASDP